MNLTTRVSIGITCVGSKTVGLDIPTDLLDEFLSYSWPTGTAADQANQSYHVAGSVSASSANAYDLIGGGLTDAFGDAVALARLKLLYVKNTHATQAITLTGLVLPLAGASIPLAAGASITLISPGATAWAITGGSTDTITVTNGTGSTGTYDLVVLGATS